MITEHWAIITDLFGRALLIAPDEQRKFVDGQDLPPEIIAIVAEMLEADRQASFLDAGAARIADELLPEDHEEAYGPYSPIRLLGRGGMGVVYLAEHVHWDIKVALKIPQAAFISPNQIERFASEQRVLARLVHSGIARIYEGGATQDGTPWFAMEYVQGEPITLYAKKNNLTPGQRLRLFRQACEAVRYAHSQAVIHRDLKPSNIFVTEEGHVKLLDFGIAKPIEQIGAGTSQTGWPLMTLAYAAPEQLRDNQVSVYSDIYSLGVVFYELLAERLPYDMNSLTYSQAERLIAANAPEMPSRISTLPLKKNDWADLDILVQKALHRDLAQRYASADALLRDLDHFERREPLDARPESTVYRLRKLVARRRWPILIGAASIALIIAMAIYFTWHLARARNEAITQAKRERAIQDFMTSLFEGEDVTNGPSKDLKVVEILAAGVKRARQFDRDPLLQGDLYRTLGDVYSTLGEQGKARPLLEMALQRFQSVTGKESEQDADTLCLLGNLEDDEGHYANAELTLRNVLRLEKGLKPPPAKVAFVEMLLARDLLKLNNRSDEALDLLKRSEPMLSEDPDAKDSRFDNWNLQALANFHLHRYPEAERLARSLVASDRQQHPRLRPTDAEDLLLLGEIEEAQAHFPAAEYAYTEALRVDESWLPKDQEDVAEARRLVAQVLVEQGRIEDASPLATEALQDLEKHYGDEHRRVAYAWRVLGKLAQAQHRWLEARTDFAREVVIYRKTANRGELPRALTDLGDADLALGDDTAAQAAYREALAIFPETEWADSPEVRHAQALLAQNR